MNFIDLFSILPVIILVGWALFLLLADLWVSKKYTAITPALAVVGLLASLVFVILNAQNPAVGFSGMILVDGFSVFLDVLFIASGIAAIGLAYGYLKRAGIHRGEYYTLVLFSISGMMLMASADNLIIVFLALELLSIPLYVLAGIAYPRLESKEASLKYFLLGTFASAFVLFGISLVFGGTQTTSLTEIISVVKAGLVDQTLFLAGSALLLAGFGFKIAAVPFHAWTPDVYQGAPSPVTAFMAVGAKAAGFAALIRVFLLGFPSLSAQLTPLFWMIAALTMIVGNVAAISQTNLKRMLAYSSIAHAGYLIMAFVPFGNEAIRANSVSSALFYLAAYAVASFGVWAVLIAVERDDGSGNDLNDIAGLSKNNPVLAIAMSVFMLSFTGIPLTLGFWGKFYLFRTAIEGGFLFLAVIGLLTSLVSAYYYLRVIVKMYFQEGDPKVHRNIWTSMIAILAALIVIGLAFTPGLLFNFAANGFITGL